MTDDVPPLRPSVIGTVINIAVTVGGLIASLAWLAAKYPDRDSFDKLKESVELMQRSAAVTEERVGRLLRASDEGTKEQLNRIEGKQDAQRRK